jgi:hypothetical protein
MIFSISQDNTIYVIYFYFQMLNCMITHHNKILSDISHKYSLYCHQLFVADLPIL